MNKYFTGISSATFDGKTSYSTYSHTLSSTSTVRTFSFEFRTLSMNGWIFRIQSGDQYYKVRLTGSNMVVLYKLGSADEKQIEAVFDVSNSVWYTAVVTETDNSVTLTLSEAENEAIISTVTGSKESGNQLTSILMASSPEIVIGNSGTYNERDPYFHGCLKEVRIGKILLPFFRDNQFVNNTSPERFLLQSTQPLENGCQAGFMCRYHQCKHQSRCIEDFYDYTCNCTAGYAGKWCENQADNCGYDSCDNGQCVSIGDSYDCRCPSGYSGDRYVHNNKT